MGIVAVLLLTAVVSATLVLLMKKLFLDFRFAKSIPVAQPVVPLLGHTPYFVGKSTVETFQNFVRLFSGVDRTAQFFLAHKMVLMVNHPDLLQQLFSRNDLYDRPFFYDFLLLGKGLISQRSGAAWKHTRRMLNPSFNTRSLTGLLPPMDACARNLATQLEYLADGTTDVNILIHANHSTLELIFRTTMDCKLEHRAGYWEYFHNLDILMSAVGKRVLNAHLYVDFIYRLTNTYRQCVKSLNYLNTFADKIIAERQRGSGPHANSHIFLDQLRSIKLEDGAGLPDKEIRDHIYTIIVAGHETSALSVSYACLLLAMYPECQEKVVAEIREVFPDRSIEVDADNLKQLEYLDCVLKECLRLIPVVPIIARQSADTFELDGVRFPAGQIIAMNFYALHRRKDLWGETADQFDPERFRPEQARDRHPYAYLPFSGGQRNCIGARYAMNSIKIMLVRILQNFEIKTKLRLEDLRFRYEISLKLEGPHEVQLVRRDLYS